jgi:flagellar biogenesis protein FliO
MLLPQPLLALALAAADAAPTAPAPARPLDLGGASTPSLGGAAAAVALLVALGVVALVLSRRRRSSGRLVEILETTALGPKRSLVVARVGGELLLLGASEAGIAVLPARLDPRAAAARTLAAAPEPPADGRADEPAGFDDLLHDSAEDQELRLKLARGLSGSVR